MTFDDSVDFYERYVRSLENVVRVIEKRLNDNTLNQYQPIHDVELIIRLETVFKNKQQIEEITGETLKKYRQQGDDKKMTVTVLEEFKNMKNSVNVTNNDINFGDDAQFGSLLVSLQNGTVPDSILLRDEKIKHFLHRINTGANKNGVQTLALLDEYADEKNNPLTLFAIQGISNYSEIFNFIKSLKTNS